MSDNAGHEGNVDHREFSKFVDMPGMTRSSLLANQVASAAEIAGRTVVHHATTPAHSRAAVAGYAFFNADESAFIEAAVDTLIPADSVGPGAFELNVGAYIDRQMAGGYGKGERWGRDTSYPDGTTLQNYEPMPPSRLLRAGIAEVNSYVLEKYKKPFRSLSTKERITVLTDGDREKVDLPTVPLAVFLELLLSLTVEGYLADARYSEKKDRAGCKMIGFPGTAAMHMDKTPPGRGQPYAVDAKSPSKLKRLH